MNPQQQDFLFQSLDLQQQQQQQQQQQYSGSRTSPTSTRGYGQQTLHRQVSRQFELDQPANFYAGAFSSNQRNFDPMSSLQPSQAHNYASFEHNSWNVAHNSMNGNGFNAQLHPAAMGINHTGAATVGPSISANAGGTRRPALSGIWPEHPQQTFPFERNGPSQPVSSAGPHHQKEVPKEEEALIPTAIVIKNIPFSHKKEMLMEIMAKNGVPLPYAFNYHFEGGVFRGLAFANFSTPEETQKVIQFMNGMLLGGRTLRVEYKRMLPAKERERVERKKRQERGQLQEQHQPQPMLHSQSSMSSLLHTTTSPSPVSTRAATEDLTKDDLDLNDPTARKFFTELVEFRLNNAKEVLVFAPELPPQHRRMIHTLAHMEGLQHHSQGQGEHRQVVVSKKPLIPSPSSNSLQVQSSSDAGRRSLNRAATTDFSAQRAANMEQYSFPEHLSLHSQGPGIPLNAQNLRNVKSVADMRSASGKTSPQPSRFDHLHNSFNEQDELMTMMQETSLHSRSNGRSAIGSHRPPNGIYQDQLRNSNSAVPERQPHLPNGQAPTWKVPFSRAERSGSSNGYGGS